MVDGWNDKKFHEKLIQNYTEMIPKVAAAGWTNLIASVVVAAVKMMKLAGKIVPRDLSK
jgi:hypothetical protein